MLQMTILIAHHHPFELWQAPAWLSERLAQAFPEHKFIQLPGTDQMSLKRMMDELPDTDIFVGWRLLPDQFAVAKRLKWVHAPTAAVHQLIFPEMVRSQVRI